MGWDTGRGRRVREGMEVLKEALVNHCQETWEKTHQHVSNGGIADGFNFLYTLCTFQIFYKKCMTFIIRKTIIIFKILSSNFHNPLECLQLRV